MKLLTPLSPDIPHPSVTCTCCFLHWAVSVQVYWQGFGRCVGEEGEQLLVCHILFSV